MSSLFKTAAMVIKTKLSTWFSKIRQWTEPEFIKSMLLVKIQGFFQSLFDVKPKDKDDYYVVFSWMISRKLAFSLLVLLGLGSLFLITMFHPFQGIGQGTVRAYRYDSLPLKFHKGEVKILAKDGHTAYVGQVEKGNAAGAGRLYGKNGELIYEGAFANSLFNGEGKLYYGSGTLKYSGGFIDNRYQGTGTGYWNNGMKEYSGGYDQGMKSGEGRLYDSGGNLILTGTFRSDLPVYEQFLGKSTEEAGTIYSGKISVYDGGGEFCVDMPQINAIYTARAGDDSLEDAYMVERVYVLADRITMAGVECDEISAVREVMGEAGYQGYSDMVLAEAVAIETLIKRGNLAFADPGIEGTRTFEEVMEVEGYRKNYDLYLYAFTYEDLVYSFYSDKKTGRFAMYSIEHAE